MSTLVSTATFLSRPGWLVLATSSLLLTGTLLYLMVSRRGETKAVTKCAVLSVWAHFILVGLAYLTSWLPTPVGIPGSSAEVRVRWIDDPGSDAIVDVSDENTRPDNGDEVLVAGPPSVTQDILEDANSGNETDPIPAPVDIELSPRDDETAERLVTPDPTTPNADAINDSESRLVSDVNQQQDESRSVGDLSATSEPARSLESPPDTIPSEYPEAERLPESPLEDRASSPNAKPLDDDDANSLLSETDTSHDRSRFNHEMNEFAAPDLSSAVSSHNMDQPMMEAEPFTASVASNVSEQLSARYAGRTKENRLQLALARGGSLDTEASVDSALAWLAKAQNPVDGRWETTRWQGGRETRELSNAAQSIQADTAMTGLALLAFLGAGHTHTQGDYQATVRRGIEFLCSQQSPVNGSLAGTASPYVAMYCHGIASLALSEALVMTSDAQLKPVVTRAVQYTLAAQHPTTGGWRYRPGDRGDTSQFGWQLMVLVSAQAAEVHIPASAFAGAERWLKRVSLGDYGGLACYTPERRIPSGSMTAEAMVCRTFVARPATPRTTDEAANFILREAQESYGVRDLYFTYYATLALYPLQDERWEAWNERLKRFLLTAQHATGELAGSWDPTTKWGPTGGRVYSTSLACLCLETYYRYLPVYELAINRGESIRRR